MDAVRFVQEFLRMCDFGGCTGCWIYAKKGTLRGLGQWRNSGKGRFLCEILGERMAEFSDILD